MRYARAGGRLVLVAVAVGAIGIVGAQFQHAIAHNIALGHELDDTRRSVAELTARKARQERDVARLQNPAGAVPEIHARLRLVGPKEELIFIHDLPPAAGAIERAP